MIATLWGSYVVFMAACAGIIAVMASEPTAVLRDFETGRIVMIVPVWSLWYWRLRGFKQHEKWPRDSMLGHYARVVIKEDGLEPMTFRTIAYVVGASILLGLGVIAVGFAAGVVFLAGMMGR